MRYSHQVLPKARKQLRSIPAKIRQRLKEAVLSLEDDPRPSGVTKLSGKKNRYRIRIGKYRIVYRILDDTREILVTDITTRSDAFRMFSFL